MKTADEWMSEIPDFHDGIRALVLSYFRGIQRDALEAAAAECDSEAGRGMENSEYPIGPNACAWRIRKLKESL